MNSATLRQLKKSDERKLAIARVIRCGTAVGKRLDRAGAGAWACERGEQVLKEKNGELEAKLLAALGV